MFGCEVLEGHCSFTGFIFWHAAANRAAINNSLEAGSFIRNPVMGNYCQD